ncbi:Fe-S cluster assembly ATPase SufC [Peptoniphilus sp.]|uniref:Fe-S cluster assembly ATPase SufC n=1 Tax=Peptoniphilus sp. TaxID=1971214 RepID=UPI0039945150
MTKELLKIENLSAGTEDKEILKNINFEINPGEVHVIMGPNGSGKTTLSNTIMGNPRYIISSGKIFFEGEDITELSTDKRAKAGIFMSFQTPMEVNGISTENFIRTALQQKTDENISFIKFRKELHKEMEKLSMDKSYGDRYLNVGFSGGEKKKNEILQLLMLNPKLAILDETDSGLDVDATRIVAEGINRYHNDENAVIIITHHRELIRKIEPDKVHVIVDGEIALEGGEEIVDRIESEGFNWIRNKVKND